MNMSLKDKKSLIVMIFVGMIISLVNYSVSFNCSVNGVTTSVSISLSAYIGYILWIVASNKIRKENKKANALFIASIAGMALSVVSIFTFLLPIPSSVTNLLGTMTDSSSASAADLNDMFEMLGEISGYMAIEFLIQLIGKALPYAACTYIIIQLVKELNENWYGTYDNAKIMKHGKKSVIFYLTMYVLLVISYPLLLKGLGGVSIDTSTNEMMMEGNSSALISFGFILLIVTAVFGILYLVFIIFTIVDVYKTQKELNETYTVSYTDLKE